MESQTQVVDAVVRWNHRDFDRLFNVHRPRLHRVCLAQTRNREDAEDAMVETSLRAYQSLSQFRGECSLSTWLVQIAKRTCIDIARRRQPVESIDDQTVVTMPDLRPTPEQMVVGTDMQGMVLERAQKAVPAWDDLDYLIFERHYGEGTQLKEIAEELGKPEGTIRGRLHTHIRPLFCLINNEYRSLVA